MELKRDIAPPLQLLPYAREIQAWLIDFLAAATDKKKPPEDYILNLDRRSHIFVDAYDIAQAVDFISVIYAEQGYMEPWKLEDRLIYCFKPWMPREAMAIATEFSAFEQNRDALTNYYQKTQTPMIMGLAALYKDTQHRDVSIFEIDFSNMRGTNEHNEKMVKAAYPDLAEQDVRDIAMDLTDQYAFLVAAAILKSVEESINIDRVPPVQLIPLRTGGDEVRVVAINMSDEEAENILPAIHREIEATTASLALHDHPHAKRPLDNFSNGFGAAGATFSLAADGQFYDTLADIDKKIGENKVIIGRQLAGDAPFSSLKPLNFDLNRIYGHSKSADVHLDYLHDTMVKLRARFAMPQPWQGRPNVIESIVDKQRLKHIPDTMEVQRMIFDDFRASLQQRNIDITPDQEKILRIKVLRFPQNDPSSGALSSRDFPAMASVALQVSHNVTDDIGYDATLWTMGVSFHNLSGLNEVLGHGYSNLVLHEQTDILRQSLHKAGLSDKSFQIAHMGNGDFSIVIQPVIMNDDDFIRILSRSDMNIIMTDIERRVAHLNKTPIGLFLDKHGIKAPDNLPTHFGEISNPRHEKCPGLQVSVSAKPYRTDTDLDTHSYRQGGAIKQFINEHLTETVLLNKERWDKEPLPPRDFTPGMSFTS